LSTRPVDSFWLLTAAVLLCCGPLIAGCSSSSPPPGDNPATVTGTSGAPEVLGSDVMSQENLKRLDELWQARTQATPTSDYPLGPGDKLAISVPGIEDLRDRNVQVSPAGNITLPVVGKVKAAGLTELQLHDELMTMLEKYMYNPQVDVTAHEARSRQVAVVGSVKAPGLITLVGPNETILDVLTRAGGMYGVAADQIVLIPGTTDARAPSPEELAKLAGSSETTQASGTSTKTDSQTESKGSDGANGTNEQARSADVAALYARFAPNSTPILIPVRSTSLMGGNKYLSIPARPGDVIVVPGGGDVMVTGWVQTPGHFAVVSGMTVLSAVGAAGGPMYAADTDDVKLVRTQDNGQKIAMSINLRAISGGEAPDIPVRGNDVIDVPYSMLKIGPYIFYNILTRAPVPVPAF
jgi:polysaccharide biosynthesis/export protein